MHFRTIATVTSVVLICPPLITQAQLPPKTQEEIAALNERVTEAARLYQQQKFLDSGEIIKDVQATLDKLGDGGDTAILEALKPIHDRLAKAHALLELEGVALPRLKPLGGEPEPEVPEGERVSFVVQVAPILVAKCGRCHIAANRGLVSMKDYAALMKGTPDGPVLVARDDDSTLLEVIRKGEMPKGGLTITSEEYKTLKAWVQQGAVFDGDDPKTELTKLKPAAENDE